MATDVLLGLLKAAAAGRPEGDLRLVVMSATLDTQKLTAYFQGSQAAYIAVRGPFARMLRLREGGCCG